MFVKWKCVCLKGCLANIENIMYVGCWLEVDKHILGYCFVYNMKVLLCLLALVATQALRLKYSATEKNNEGFVRMSPLKENNYGNVSMQLYNEIIK